MDLFPNDLGEQVARQVQHARSQASFQPEAAGTRPQTAAVFGLILSGTAVISGLLSVPGLAVLLGIGAFCYLGWAGLLLIVSPLPNSRLRQAVSRYELQSIRQSASDTLLQRYLDLALSVVNLPATKDEIADREVRDAMTALGTALEALPPEQMLVTDDPAVLQAEADAQIAAAQTEPDAVIAASRRRRAESLLRRADTAARTLLLLRRNQALREEVGEQIQALGTSLTALQVGGRQSAPELSGLAASIQRVALEANAVTVARAEVDTLLSQPGRGVETEQGKREEVNFSR